MEYKFTMSWQALLSSIGDLPHGGHSIIIIIMISSSSISSSSSSSSCISVTISVTERHGYAGAEGPNRSALPSAQAQVKFYSLG